MLYLASKSPRRRQLLEQLGYRFQCLDVDVPEQRNPRESPQDYVARVAQDKARAGLAACASDPGAVVLGADTEVVLEGEVFGKPADAAAASAMLARLSGRRHQVISAVWLVDAGRQECAVSVTEVYFAPLAAAEIEAYLACGEAFGKAGAYAIQGRAAAFVTRIEGSYSGVMGLPLHETSRLLARFGIAPAPVAH